ncbi:MAG: prepilin peptidase [Patescibacteria group bacterium]
MTTVVLFVLGVAVGSFLNVVGLRWGTDGVLSGRSHCPSCHKCLRWYELVPVVSFLIQKARCRGCRAKISWQYPLIEFWTGLIFITVPYVFLPVFCIYVVITIYDFKHKIIPDGLVYASVILAFLTSYFLLPTPYSMLDWLTGPILFVFFASIWLFSRGRAMGFGDAKLSLSVGLLLGASQGFSAIVLAFWIGALGSLTYLFLNKLSLLSAGKAGLSAGKAGFLKNTKKITMKSEIPFAPFIIVGVWISLIFHLDILHVALF